MDESTGREAVEADVVPAEVDAEEEVQTPSDDTEEGEEEEVIEEVEYDLGGGQKLRVPATATAAEVFDAAQKAFKDVEANYTRKHQDVAEKAKAIEAQQRVVEKLQSLSGEALDTYSRGLTLKAELEQLQQVDLNALWQSKPDQARRVSDMISQKQAEFQRVVSRVSDLESNLSREQEAEASRRLEDGRKEVTRRIPNFDENAVVEYAISKGIPKEDAGKWPLNPVFTEAMWKAMQFDRLQSKAKQPAKPSAPEPKPMTPIGGRGGRAAKTAATMTPGEMARHLGLPG